MRKKLIPYLIFASGIIVVFKIALLFDLWSNLDSRCIKLPFHSSELSHLFTSLVLGLALKGAPHFTSDIRLLHLWAIVGENGLHFYLFSKAIDSFFPFLNIKKYNIYLLILLIILTLSPALIRIFMFRIIMILQRRFKIKINHYLSLCIVFFISYLMGHFVLSPKGFILSFCFWICFFWGKRKTRIEQILIFSFLYSLMAIYFREEFSMISILFSIIILWIYIKSYRFFLFMFLYSLIFKWTIPIEKGLKYFFGTIHWISHNLLIDTTSTTLVAAIVIALSIITKRPSIIFLLLIFRIEYANGPTIFWGG